MTWLYDTVILPPADRNILRDEIADCFGNSDGCDSGESSTIP